MAGNFYGNNGMYGNNPYYNNPQHSINNLMNQYPQYFNSQAMQNAIQSQQQHQQGISTQPPIMQPQNDIRNSAKLFYVGNKEEATATPVDLVYSTPTFFYNRGTNEVYLKQYDATTGNALFKVYIEQKQIQPKEETHTATVAIPNNNVYMNELKMIRAGVEGLYRYLNQPKQQHEEIIDVEYEEETEQPRIEKKGTKK